MVFSSQNYKLNYIYANVLIYIYKHCHTFHLKAFLISISLLRILFWRNINTKAVLNSTHIETLCNVTRFLQVAHMHIIKCTVKITHSLKVDVLFQMKASVKASI